MTSPDVIIVGGGLAGCSVAWHLAPHRRVLLLEQGEQPGAEASAQNAGMVRRLGEDPYERALALRTHRWLEDGPPEEDWPDAPSRKTGALLALTHEPAHLHDAASHLKDAGASIEACDRPATIAPVLAGTRLSFAWHLPDERVADAWTLVSGFLRGAKRHGAEIRTHARATSLIIENDRVVGVQTDRGPIAAPEVVLAAGAWGAHLTPSHLHRPLLALRRTLLQSAPHPISSPEHPWTWIDDIGLYVRPEGGGWMLSGCDEALDPPKHIAPGSRGPVEPLARALALDKLKGLPALRDLRLSGGWTGLRTFAPDRRPILGPDPELPGLHWAAGLGGFGVTCSYAVGEAVAAWLQSEELPWLDAAPVSPARAFPRRWAIRPTGDVGAARLIASP